MGGGAGADDWEGGLVGGFGKGKGGREGGIRTDDVGVHVSPQLPAQSAQRRGFGGGLLLLERTCCYCAERRCGSEG